MRLPSSTCVLLGGWTESELSNIDDVLEVALGNIPPVVVLAQSHLTIRLRDLVDSSFVDSVDHEIPAASAFRADSLPLVLFHAISPSNIRVCLSGLKSLFPQV